MRSAGGTSHCWDGTQQTATDQHTANFKPHRGARHARPASAVRATKLKSSTEITRVGLVTERIDRRQTIRERLLLHRNARRNAQA